MSPDRQYRTLTRHALFHLHTDTCTSPIPMEADLAYASNDPYAVRLTFHSPGCDDVEWVFARDMLLDGCSRVAGIADVVVRPFPYRRNAGQSPTSIVFELTSPDGYAKFSVTPSTLLGFLSRTYEIVPPGAESPLLDLDAQLRELLDTA